MSSRAPLRRSSARRWLWRALIAALVSPVAAFPFLGRWLVAEDPLQAADVIIVLAGAPADRWLEAVELRAAGYAPTIVLSRGTRPSGEAALKSRGVTLPNPADLARDAMVQLGVPADAIAFLPDPAESTAEEAVLVRRLARSSGWRRVIVVTSKQHTRRARLAFRRELRDAGVEPVVRASRYDEADPAHWWRTRRDVRATVFEWIKLVAYAAGLGA